MAFDKVVAKAPDLPPGLSHCLSDGGKATVNLRGRDGLVSFKQFKRGPSRAPFLFI